MSHSPLTYEKAGVDSAQQERAMPLLAQWVERTFALRRGSAVGAVKLPLGFFANVLDIGHNLGLAVSTDGVGTKILIAEMLHKFDTIGIDCVAMNVNDVLCVGAEPIALLDYIAVQEPHPEMLEAIAHGLYVGSEQAGITIPGGEIAQVKEMICGVNNDGYAFDLIGTCLGLVPLDSILTGQHIAEGDVVIGLRSSGVHSNGLTLARRVFFDQGGLKPTARLDELGRSIGEELLEPTRIYVKEVLEVLRAGIKVKGLAHITSTGFLNLNRFSADVGFVLDHLPEPPAVFQLIQERGNIPSEEMYFTYNMGIGFCVIVSREDVSSVQAILKRRGIDGLKIGYAVSDLEKSIVIPSVGIVGKEGAFLPQ